MWYLYDNCISDLSSQQHHTNFATADTTNSIDCEQCPPPPPPVLMILTDRQALKHLSSNECFNLHFQAQLRKELNAEKFKNEVLSRYLNCTWLYDLVNVAWLFMWLLTLWHDVSTNEFHCILFTSKEGCWSHELYFSCISPPDTMNFLLLKTLLRCLYSFIRCIFKGCMLHSLSALQSWALFLMLPFPHHMEVIGWLTTCFVSCGSCLLNKAVVNYFSYN